MQDNLFHSFHQNFLGGSSSLYKKVIIAFLVINPIALYTVGPFVTGWLFVAEFIFTLAMALKCYPLQPGGLLAIQAIILGLTTSKHVMAEVTSQIEVLLLLVFMAVSYTHLPSPRDATLSRMPSSA